MADEPTIGEVVRLLAGLQRTVDKLDSKVLTIEVWRAERELIESRIRENEKDITTLEAKVTAERDKREREKAEADTRAASHRRQALFAVLTSLVFPILVAIVLAVILKG